MFSSFALQSLRWLSLSLLLLTLHSVQAADAVSTLIQNYCVDCHGAGTKKGDISLEDIDPAKAATNPKLWEKVVQKLHHRQMPPLDEPRPDEAAYARVVAQLTSILDDAAAASRDAVVFDCKTIERR